ncbi:MipA/OmpV family protein [Pseudokordiimonas caeni]|uniref:MipA/OmpV family protein n=1 Tax=Pseudokordiimonas caeni TaxID=2997908 RepID=UPI002811CF18|nr:MipA/OmpV family protein [Pseudokordiimonas caeni]
MRFNPGTSWALLPAAAILAALPAHGDDDDGAGGPPRWSVGAIGLYYDTPFAAEDNEFQAVPYVAYRGDRFFIDATALGYHLIKPDEEAGLSFGLDVIAAARMLPGESRNKVTADMGLRASIGGGMGRLDLTALQDVTDTHNGTELSAIYEYDFQITDKFTLSPSVGVTWQSRKLANHMWGITQKQQDRMIEKDKPVLPLYALSGSVVNYQGGLTAVYGLSDSWTLIGFAEGAYLDKDIRDHPGIDKKYELTLGFGLAYNF